MDIVNIQELAGYLAEASPQVRLLVASNSLMILQQNHLELSSELRQYKIQIAKADRLKGSNPEGSEDWLTWDDIKLTAIAQIEILQKRIHVLDVQISAFDSMYKHLSESVDEKDLDKIITSEITTAFGEPSWIQNQTK